MQPRGTELQQVEEEQGQEIDPNEHSIEINEVDEQEEEEIEEGPEGETARETVERVLEKTRQDEDTGNEGKENQALQPKKQDSQVESNQQVAQPIQVDPPVKLQAKSRELFSKLPPELQQEWAKISKEEQAHFTKVTTEAARARDEYRATWENPEAYLRQNPNLIEAGYTPSTLSNALLATHMKLTNTSDPGTQIKTATDILAQIGVAPDYIEPILEAYQGNIPPPQYAPQNNDLQKRIDALESTQVQQRVAPIVSEMEAIRNERDSQGNLLYPELFENDFLSNVKSLVSDLVGTVPGITYGEALKRAWSAKTGKSYGNSSQVAQTKLPAENNTPQRATSAAVSVRGKTSSSKPDQSLDIPQEALGSARDSAEWALKMLRGN